MALNFGVNNKSAPKDEPSSSLEGLLDAYMDFESVVRATDIFVRRGDRLENALENICIVGKAMMRHNSNEALATVRDIVRDELGAPVSMETLKERGQAVLSSIKEFFKKVGVWFQEFFARIFNAVARANKRLEEAYKAVNALPDNAKFTWSYKGFNLMTSGFNQVRTIDSTDDIADGVSNAEDLAQHKASEKARYDEIAKTVNTVNDKGNTLAVISNARDITSVIEKLRNAFKKDYDNAKDWIKNASTEEEAERYRDAQKRLKVMMALTSKKCAVLTRTLMSVVVHIPMRAIQASATPAT